MIYVKFEGIAEFESENYRWSNFPEFVIVGFLGDASTNLESVSPVIVELANGIYTDSFDILKGSALSEEEKTVCILSARPLSEFALRIEKE